MPAPRILLAMVTVFGLGVSELFGVEVAVGYAMHVGARKYDQDRSSVSNFKVNGIQYHLAFVADGHGSEERGHEVAEYVKNNMSNIIEQELQSNKPHQALLNAFAICEKNILSSQDSTQKQPGTTVALSLADLTNKKRHIANLGDSRTSILNSRTGEVIFQTKDHKLEGTAHSGVVKSALYNYIINHGGDAQVTNYGHVDVVINLNGFLEHLAVPCALGDAHFKTFTKADDGTVGPVNSVPDIYEIDIKEDEIEKIESDGSTEHLDQPEYQTLQDCWKYLFDMKEEEFNTKFFWGGDKKSLRVLEKDMGGDEQLKKIAARMIYILYYISQRPHGADNTTVLLRTITESSSSATTTTTPTTKTSPTKLNTTKPIEKSGTSWGTIAGGGLFTIGVLGLIYLYFYHNRA